jgi:hypothetical protein
MNGRLRNQRLSIGGFLRDGLEQQLRIGGELTVSFGYPSDERAEAKL